MHAPVIIRVINVNEGVIMTVMTTEQIQAIIDKYKDQVPVKVGAIAEELGISLVSTTELPPNNSGSLVKEKNGRYTIYVDQTDSIRRQRFTIAHEIGHFVEHHHREFLDKVGEILNARKTLYTRPNGTAEATTYKKIEKEADAFAGDLLMPKDKFIQVWENAQTLREVADTFGVSEMAANVRAAVLGLGVFR